MQNDLIGRGQALLYMEDVAAETTQPLLTDTASGPPAASDVPDLGLSHTSSSIASEVVSMVVDAPAQLAPADTASGPPAASDAPEVPRADAAPTPEADGLA